MRCSISTTPLLALGAMAFAVAAQRVPADADNACFARCVVDANTVHPADFESCNPSSLNATALLLCVCDSDAITTDIEPCLKTCTPPAWEFHRQACAEAGARVPPEDGGRAESNANRSIRRSSRLALFATAALAFLAVI